MHFLSYPASINRKGFKKLAYLILVFGTLSYTFAHSIQNGMHQVIPGALGYHTTAMGIAISELKYGLKGYQYYGKVKEALENNGMTSEQKILNKYGMTQEEIITDGEILNNAIQKTLNIENISSGGKSVLIKEDLGIVTFYKLAFKIFGFKIESLFYLYFLLIFVSVIIYIVVFHNQIDLWNILLLYICSHFVIVAAAPSAGIELLAVHNDRFLPVLAVLPTLYLSFLILGKHILTLKTLIGATFQVAILMLVIHARTGTLYQVMFLSTIFFLAILWYWKQSYKIRIYLLKKVRFWPLAIVFVGFFILKMYLLIYLHNSYTDVRSKHLLWHPIYRGLGAHPDSNSKYGIEYVCDICSDQLVAKIVNERYGTKEWITIGGFELYESILKEEYMRILVNDPLYVAENYLYKLNLFFKNYFGFNGYKAGKYLFNWIIFCLVVLGGMMSGGLFLKLWSQYFFLIALGFAFSLLPTMIAMPMSPLISDPALLFTFVIYIIISGLSGYLMQIFPLRQVRKN